MQTVIYNTGSEIIGLGSPDSKTQFLLPTPPAIETNEVSVSNIVTTNGNHWRKIFVIIAKLCCHDQTWQSYRDQHLLSDVYLNFSPNPNLDKDLNIVCGKSHAQTLGFDESTPRTTIDSLSRVSELQHNNKHRVLFTPYLDYRQFPNALIEEVLRAL